MVSPYKAPTDCLPHTRRLRIMVCPHELIVGGSQINAIDLAALMLQRGHNVEVYAPPGPLISKIKSFGIPYVPAPARTQRELTLHALMAFGSEVSRFRPDVVHTYESPPTILSAAVSPIVPHRCIATVLSMSVPDYIPEDTTLIVGTEELVRRESWRCGTVHLMEPPVDADFDAPTDPVAARMLLGVPADQFVVAVVGRLSTEHQKGRGVVSAIDELRASILNRPITLLIAGSGDKEVEIRSAMERARSNSMLSIRMEGNVLDPRNIYDAADVVFGMGSSAIRAMAHAKPLVVQGRDGFWELLTPETVDTFIAQGFFGEGPSGGPSLVEVLLDLAGDPKQRADLGAFGRALVLERYSIHNAVSSLESICYEASERQSNPFHRARSLSFSLFRYLRFTVAINFPWIQQSYRSFRKK